MLKPVLKKSLQKRAPRNPNQEHFEGIDE